MAAPIKPSDVKAVLASATSSLCDNFIDTLLRFPILVYKFINWFLDADGNISTTILNTIYQPGFIILSARNDVPDGWLLCNGQLVSRTTYADLFTQVGESFGAGDGVTNFAVPDMRDAFAMGSGNKAISDVGGEATHVLAGDEFVNKDHTHAIGRLNGEDGGAISGYFQTGTASPALGGSGYRVKGNGAEVSASFDTLDHQDMISLGVNNPQTIVGHNNLPPYVVLAYLIKT